MLKLITLILIYVLFNIDIIFTKRPNIIIFVGDDLGWDDVGFHGSNQIKTPNIDTLAADGILLNNYYTSPVCSPSRSAILTGVHPIHSGLQNYVILTSCPWGLPLNIKTLPQYLSKFGYKSHAVGKWHLGFFKKAYTPTFRGFDSHVGFWSGSGDYYEHTHLDQNVRWGLDFHHNLEPIYTAGDIYSTHYFTRRSLHVIENQNTTDPLFLYVAYQSAHNANSYDHLQAPKKYVDRFAKTISNENRRIFAGNVNCMDESIGIIFNALHQKGMLEDSVVIFISDNGGPAHGFTGNAASNWPLRGVKATLWEGGIRVPGLIWSPKLNNSGYISTALMHATDWLPTLLEAISNEFDGEINDPLYENEDEINYPIYGKSMWQSLSYRLPSTRYQLLHNIDPIWNVSAIRISEWKLVQGLVFPKWSGWYPPFGGISNEVPFDDGYTTEDCLVCSVLEKMQRKPKYEILKNAKIKCGHKPENATTNCQPDIKPCLFNIEKDPCEYNNVAEEFSDIADFLWQSILNYNATAVPPGTKPIDPMADPKFHNYLWTYWKDE